MQHTAFKQAERLLKRSLKGKVSITRALVIGFLMTGLVSTGGVAEASMSIDIEHAIHYKANGDNSQSVHLDHGYLDFQNGHLTTTEVGPNGAVKVNVVQGTLTPNATDGTVTGSATGVAKAADVAAAINNSNTVLTGKIDANTAKISANTDNITKNTNNIAANTAKIADNTAKINDNATAIAKNVTDIATNKAGIVTNTAAIAQNATDIATNKADIATNTAAIAQNATDIATNKAGIATNTAAIAQNATDIATNKADIATNTADIAANKTAIAQNATDIAGNTTKINANTAAITKNATDIANNTTAITNLGNNTFTLNGDSTSTTAQTLNKNGGLSFKVAGDGKYISTVAAGDTVTVSLDEQAIKDAASVSNGRIDFSGDNKDAADPSTTLSRGFNQALEFVGGADVANLSDRNIGVNVVGNKMEIKLAKDLTGLTSSTFTDGTGNTTVVNGAGISIQGPTGNSQASAPVTLTANGLDNGGNRIANVADGVASTDVATVGQLRNMGSNTAMAITNLQRESQRIGAQSAAMAALKPIQYDPLEPTQIMAGIGNYRGETAGALGIAHYTNENTMFHIGATIGNDNNMVNAGVTHKFGSSAEKEAIPERYKAGPISSMYVMQTEMSQLQKENTEQKEVIAAQQHRLSTMETENAQQKQQLDAQQKSIDELKVAVAALLARG
ncbi:YadA-like family protein [Veillonella caviae]|uniref:YadA family autotransporter adhesin n=1 Tax=Veillonella caviae TaxID=248316 RepID=UPI002A90E549|nr:YadA-like family protein [Veillonella caviae]MDY6225466.1 YadA-like family protein [Veillonella caviae]